MATATAIPMDAFVEAGLKGVVPALLAVVLLGLPTRGRLLPLALALGYCVAFVLRKKEWPDLPHQLWNGTQDGTQWLWWIVLLAGLLATASPLRWLPRRVPELLGFLLLVALPFLVTANVRRRMPVLDAVLLVGAGAALLLVLWVLLRFVLEAAAAAPQAGLVLVLLTACLIGDAAVLFFTGSALMAQLAGALAAGVAMTAVAATVRPVPLDRSLALILTAGHGGLLFLATCVSELPRWPALAAGLAPTGLCLLQVRGLARRPRLLRWTTVAVTVGLLTCAVAAVYAPPSGF